MSRQTTSWVLGRFLFGLVVSLGLAGCILPIGADRTSIRRSYQQLNESVLTSSRCSSPTEMVLHRYDVVRQFKTAPEPTLKLLHDKAGIDDRRDVLYALSELSYLHADHLRRSVKPGEPPRARDYFLSSAIYAYLYVLGDGKEAAPDAFDRRFRVACDLYNRALARGLLDQPGTNAVVQLAGGRRMLPNGAVDVIFKQPAKTCSS